MKKIIFYLFVICFTTKIQSQNPGDTIVVKAFKYGSPGRDTVLNFPPGNLTFEKIIMKYNMRCKNGLISNQGQPNQGCGEWDYSCNTYVVDSSKIENALNTTPSHLISNFTGTTFPYTSAVPFDYYNFMQNVVVLNNIVSENQYTVGVGSATLGNFLKANEKSGRSQLLYTAAELIAAGFSAGNIDGIMLNVASAGGGINFFKVGIKHTSALTLNSSTVSVTNFTNVFNSNTTFTVGNNRVQFHTPFVWDGTSNVLIDFSFTNTVPTNPMVFNGTSSASVMALYANNNYALNLESFGHAIINTASLVTINNEITVTMWAYGNATLMPTVTSIIYGWGSNPDQRNLNIHLPWNNNNVYFDCGFAANNFDRIDKTALAVNQGGQWNHWAFTKNAVTGNMRIYLNGVLWHSGTGMTKTISIMNLILGKDKDYNVNYKGKINELTIWDEELSLGDIQAWMNKPYNASHPFYSNLLAYYTMNEGAGQNILDTKNNLNSAGTNLQWTYDRGHKLNRTFFETTLRPNVVFLRGVYNITTNTITVKDSVAHQPNVVLNYSITPNNTVVPMTDDAVVLVSTNTLYAATVSKTFDGDTEVLTGTAAIVPTATINISTLNYYRRYPFYNEMLSFVTPYGKGLDMGINGKTWYYDVTDFAPVLKDKKRFLMSLGGQYQEQMDIDFWFIVGTPPRTVLQFNQLWQGAARDGGASIGSITSDVRFNTLNVPTLANGKYFKMRSVITGHGSEGEFHQNGGVITHSLNIAGGAPEFSWPITMECGWNPIIAQGGTWVYDRQGWCPGQASVFKEYNFTPYVTPGNTVTIDYNTSNPPVVAGDYRYIASHQLITYGGANHSLDANVLDVYAPNNKVFNSKKNPICASPVILVQNTGSVNLTSLDIDYWVNNTPVKQTYTWTGNLAFMDTVFVSLPINGIWQNGLQPTNNVFNVELRKANSLTDDYAFNNVYHSPFTIPGVISSTFSVEFKTNNYPGDNSYQIVDDLGNIVVTKTFSLANFNHSDTYVLNGCYKFIVNDAGGDGLQWWANPGQGSGSVYLLGQAGSKSFVSDFGNGFEWSFTTDGPLKINENVFGSLLNLYPNPASNKFVIEGDELQNSEIQVMDVLGHVVKNVNAGEKRKTEIDISTLSKGVYFVSISKYEYKTIRKLIVE